MKRIVLLCLGALLALQPSVLAEDMPVIEWSTRMPTSAPTVVPSFTAAPTVSAEIYGLAIMNISTRTGPSPNYEDMGTYELKGQYLRILARAYDSINEIWWVKCVIPSSGLALWTGYRRFDPSTLPLGPIPIEVW